MGSISHPHTLGQPEQAELLAALESVVRAGIGPDTLTAADFPLPRVTPMLTALAAEVTHGRGFALLQGIPVAGLTEERADLLAVGIAGQIGRVVPQGPANAPVLHIRDRGADPALPTTRSYQHSAELNFHRDPTDVLGLLCLRPARSGGRTMLIQPEKAVLTMDLRPGDLLLVNNRVMMHSRTEYRDDPRNPRDLIRIWLDDVH